jgi:MFS superfamily sulfate permease-like transporter
MGILTNPFVVHNDSPDFAVLLCFLVGCIIVLIGLLRLGKSTRPNSEFVCSVR